MGNAFKHLFSLMLIALWSSSVCAITFMPNYTKVLFTEMDGWVKGQVFEKAYKKDVDGKILTVVSLDIEKFSGLSRAQITNFRHFEVLYPGGAWQGVNVTYSGSPSVEIGQVYYFLLRKKRGGFFVSGMGSGVIGDLPQNIDLINELEVFSEKKFQGIRLANSDATKAPLVTINKKRMPAGGRDTQRNEPSLTDENDFSTTIVVFIMALIVFVYLLLGRNESTKN